MSKFRERVNYYLMYEIVLHSKEKAYALYIIKILKVIT
jgi:hypothetical protein